MKLCLKNGFIVDPANKDQRHGNLWIEDGILIEKPTLEDEDTTYIDACGKWIVPGFIDLHVHFREPGFEYKEDIKSGCQAAAKGGFTTVCCMPNTEPSIDSPSVIAAIEEKVRLANGVDVFSVGAITMGQQGEMLADYIEMQEVKTRAYALTGRAICGISEDGKSVADTALMRQAMLEAKKQSLPVFSHAEPEAEMVERDLRLAEETGCKLHFCHISEKESLAHIRRAKAGGIAVTAETAPHYFTLEEAMVQGDSFKKMNPPLKQKADVEAVIEALKDGTLDIIATDHAPHHEEEKKRPFPEAPFGVIGLETSFAVSYTRLVKTGILTPLQLIDKMSTRPAEIIGIDRGSLSVGKVADITIVDVEEAYTIGEEPFVSKAKNSPFLGMKVFGRIDYTVKDGKVLWERRGK